LYVLGPEVTTVVTATTHLMILHPHIIRLFSLRVSPHLASNTHHLFHPQIKIRSSFLVLY